MFSAVFFSVFQKIGVGKGLVKGWHRAGKGLAKGWRVSLHPPGLQFPRLPFRRPGL